MTGETFESFHKVRTFECDFYGHVNNAIYLNYLEFARMELLEKKGLTLTRLKEMGFMLVIRRVEIRFKAPALAQEQLAIRTLVKEYRKASGTFHQKIIKLPDQKLIAEADVNWVVVNSQGKPVAIPARISEALGLQRPAKKG